MVATSSTSRGSASGLRQNGYFFAAFQKFHGGIPPQVPYRPPAADRRQDQVVAIIVRDRLDQWPAICVMAW